MTLFCQHPLDHGKIIAVIRYHTPYLIDNRDPWIIYFALGNDISLHCVSDISLALFKLVKVIVYLFTFFLYVADKIDLYILGSISFVKVDVVSLCLL